MYSRREGGTTMRNGADTTKGKAARWACSGKVAGECQQRSGVCLALSPVQRIQASWRSFCCSSAANSQCNHTHHLFLLPSTPLRRCCPPRPACCCTAPAVRRIFKICTIARLPAIGRIVRKCFTICRREHLIVPNSAREPSAATPGPSETLLFSPIPLHVCLPN